MKNFLKIERILEKMGYVYWDAFVRDAPSLLFVPLESVSEKQIAAKSAAKAKELTYPESSDVRKRLRLLKRLHAVEICLLVCLVVLIGLILFRGL
ncbi:hypothetical protein [Helicobacter turcicus]|uniref:Uncharacterized protein n=1 Tax=Helicobacter turcicus TaxID=2867412 RepID=A0ABS7JMG0_9HELI|nr:hypothetical protein [Helicobacter turcicus]MBX7490565.1 hypothetical protein [Helicobacter turcicus]MBX7545525.1 hypothetical protein [Helicobacter turcicus]